MVVGDTAEILTVGVVPAARRTGIGRRLLAALLAEAVRRGATEAFLEARVDNDAALRALRRARASPSSAAAAATTTRGRVDAITMRKDLTAA